MRDATSITTSVVNITNSVVKGQVKLLSLWRFLKDIETASWSSKPCQNGEDLTKSGVV